MTGKKASVKTVEQFTAEWNSGFSIQALAKKYRLDPGTISRHLKKRNLDTTRNGRFKRKTVNEEKIKEMVELWDAGHKLRKIAEILKLSPSTVDVYLLKKRDTSHGGKYKPFKLEKHTNEIIQLWQEGKSAGKIAKIFNCTKDGILSLLQRKGIDTSERWPKATSKEIIKQMIELYRDGLSTREIGIRNKMSDWTVRKWLKRNGVDTSTHPLAPNKVKVETRNQIVDLWNNGMPTRRIAERFQLSKSTVLLQLHKAGIDTSRGSKFDFNTLFKKYEIMQKILVEFFELKGYSIESTNDYFHSGPDLIVRNKENELIPVEFKAEQAWSANFRNAFLQIQKYIQKLETPYGYLVTTANTPKQLQVDDKIRIIFAKELYNALPDRKLDLDFIRYTPVKNSN